MKKIFLSLILMSPVILIAQSGVFPLVDCKINYTEIVKIDSSINKATLFLNAKMFFVNEFKSAKDVIQLEDRESGTIIGKGYFTYNWDMGKNSYVEMKIWHTIKLTIKDGKYRYEITDFIHSDLTHIPGLSSSWSNELPLEKMKIELPSDPFIGINNNVNIEIKHLKKTMLTQSNTNF